MSDDSLAPSPSDASATAEVNYNAIHATIVATERGRWFLNEHVRRYRGADTALVLASLDRIEEAIRGTAGPVPAAQDEILALLETIWQARGEVIGRHGDPAASGEAAVSDFRYATEQIQGLVLAARAGDADPDPGGQLAFQLSRLSGAGDRLERSVAALRVMLGLFDEIERRLHRLADAGPVDEATAPPPEPSTEAVIPVPEPPALGQSVLERLEAREYRRRNVMTADWTVATADWTAAPVASAIESPMPEQVSASASPSETLWEQYTSARLPEAMLGPAPLCSQEPPAAAPLPSPFQDSPASLSEPQPAYVPLHVSEQGIGADQPSVIDRLENMRTAIAALMDEVSEKTAGRIPPPARS
jgi:hypothetical protein